METFFQSSIDTRGGVLSLKINIVITFKQGSDFKPDCYVTKIYMHQSSCETSFKI